MTVVRRVTKTAAAVIAVKFGVCREKGTGTFCAKPGTSRRLVEGRSGKRCLSPFPERAWCAGFVVWLHAL